MFWSKIGPLKDSFISSLIAQKRYCFFLSFKEKERSFKNLLEIK